MGFTRWPADLTLEGFLTAQNFAHEHGDIVSVMFIGGIPWPRRWPTNRSRRMSRTTWRISRRQGKKLFLSICPVEHGPQGPGTVLGRERQPAAAGTLVVLRLNSPEVKKAYLNFVLRAVKAMQPAYLAIGVENNVLLSHSAEKWAELKELHRETYAAVKQQYPDLPVCFTTEVLHYKKLASDARGSDQETQVAELMKHSDLFAMSIYPHMSYDVPRPVPADFFDFARQFRKPIAVSESGDTSRDVELKAYHLTLKGSEAGQTAVHSNCCCSTASRDQYAFVILFATTDFEKLCEKLPKPVDDLARIWAYTGCRPAIANPNRLWPCGTRT